jgi:ABC-type Na+ efflux pump permease subunit
VFVLQTALVDLVRRLRDPLAFALWLGIPLAVGGLITLAFGGDGETTVQAEVLVADDDGTVLSGALVAALRGGAERGVPIVAEAVDGDEGRARMEEGGATALLVIPAGFQTAVLAETPCTLELVTNPSQRILPALVEEALELLVDAHFYAHRVLGEPLRRVVTESTAAGATSDELVAETAVEIGRAVERIEALVFPPAIRVEVGEPEAAEAGDEEDGARPRGIGGLFLPSMLFMALFFMAEGMSEDLWRIRASGALRRALCTPHHPAAFLAGKLLAAMVLTGVVALAGLLLVRYAFGLHLVGLPLAALWAALAGGLFTALLQAVQVHSSSQRGGNLAANLVMMPLLMIGGSFFPLEVMPDWMAAVGRATPNGWAMEQFKAIVWGGAEAGALLPAAAGIAGVTALLFAVTVRRLAGPFARGTS